LRFWNETGRFDTANNGHASSVGTGIAVQIATGNTHARIMRGGKEVRNKYNQCCIALSVGEVPCMVVFEMKIGNTIVRGHDDCVVRTAAERQEILDNVGRIAAGIYRDKEKKQKEGTG